MTDVENEDSPRRRLQRKLRELFQFESSDLDFGIYRILNQRRTEIEAFIERDLLDAVGEVLSEMVSGSRSDMKARLEEARLEVQKTLGAESLDASGEIVETYRNVPVAKHYLELRSQLESMAVAESTEARIYSDLLKFFSRYYEGGDFLTLRRHSSRGHKYMVPYDGEEVMFHWANKDQYFIKTGERFTDYRFEAADQKVRFSLLFADTPANSNKATGRYFMVPGADSVLYDADQKLLTIHFTYRQVTEREQDDYLQRYREITGDKRKSIDRSIVNVVTKQQIIDALGSPNIKARLLANHPNSKSGHSVLSHHLHDYTGLNTHDYFIHKNLGGFLRRELDFFLKSEVLNVDNLLLNDDVDEAFDHQLIRARAVRRIGERVIQFLSQIEDFQKRLFEKKKFVVETDWCVTLDRVPESLYPTVLKNEAQLEKWFDTYAIDKWADGPKSPAEIDDGFLRKYPSMMVDTAFFEWSNKVELISTIDELHESTDGFLIKGDNFHALDLAANVFAESVTCCYIDPPYNTGNDGFIYRDRYQHSCWLSMMADRLNLASLLLTDDAIFTVSVDDHEVKRLRFIVDDVFGEENCIAELIWKARQFIDSRANTRVSNDHEYILCYRTSDRGTLRGAEKDLSKYSNPDDDARGLWMSRSILGLANAQQRPNLHYDLIDPETGNSYPCPEHTGWRYSTTTMQKKIEEGRILWPSKLDGRPREKVFLDELNDSYTGFSTLIDDVFTAHGSSEMRDFFGELAVQFPKPSELVKRLVEQADAASGEPLVLDYFAGSGTTAQAVVDLNRDADMSRKYFLVEMGDHFDTVLRPRIQKTIFAKAWLDGVPQTDETGGFSGVRGHVFKYQRLESYEDALNNIELSTPKLEQGELPEDYMLGYMLDIESRGSKSLLDQVAFVKPFEYRLKIQRGEVTPRPTKVDLQETFHYLIGMRVQKIEVHEHQGRVYHISRGRIKTVNGFESAIVVWRDLLPELDFEAEREWAELHLFDKPMDRVFANGPSGIEGAERIEHTFKERMDPAYGGQN